MRMCAHTKQIINNVTKMIVYVLKRVHQKETHKKWANKSSHFNRVGPLYHVVFYM